MMLYATTRIQLEYSRVRTRAVKFNGNYCARSNIHTHTVKFCDRAARTWDFDALRGVRV